MQTLSTRSKHTASEAKSYYVHTRVISEQRNRVTKPVYTRSERQGYRIRTKQTLQNLASAIGNTELSDKVGRCYGKVAVITCGKHIAQLLPDYTCGFRLCPDCARRRASKLLRKYLPSVVAFPVLSKTEPVHLVLTQAHRSETLRESVKRLTDHFKMLRRRSVWKDHFKGGMFSVEFTIGRDGLYHTHLHILAFRTRFFNVQLLKDAWLEITGDSSVLRLDRLTGDPVDALREVLKYAVKPACIDDFTPTHLRDFMAMRNQRLVGTFGEFQKFAREYKPDPDTLATLFPPTARNVGAPCSTCGDPLRDVRVNGSELADFLERLDISQCLE
jgi:hypothetical protein